MPTLRQLRYFVAVAEDLSFVRAASRLHVSQPPLSSQIKSLEEELGVRLLDRDTRSVHLTAAGRVFLDGARRILEDLQLLSRKASRTAAGDIGLLRIGFVASSVYSVLPGVLSHLSEHLPGVQFSLQQQGSLAMVDWLRREEIDLAFFHAPPDVEDIQSVAFFREPLCAILPKRHRLAEIEDFNLGMLAGEPFINFARTSAPAIFDTVVGACIQAGFSPDIVHSGDFGSMVQMVGLGLGVALVPATLAARSSDLVEVRDLGDDVKHLSVDLGWKRYSTSALVPRAVEAFTGQNRFSPE
jgi:DNA-binding transcriptional LysR family regulator